MVAGVYFCAMNGSVLLDFFWIWAFVRKALRWIELITTGLIAKITAAGQPERINVATGAVTYWYQLLVRPNHWLIGLMTSAAQLHMVA